MSNNQKINFNPLTEEPVYIDLKHKKNPLNKKRVFNKEDIIVKSSEVNLSFLIFHFEEIKKRYNIDYQDVMILLYLQELGLFRSSLIVFGLKIDLKELTRVGYVIESFKNKTNVLYKLTDRANEVLFELNLLIKNNNGNIMKNRTTDLSLEAKTKGVLDNYYSKSLK